MEEEKDDGFTPEENAELMRLMALLASRVKPEMVDVEGWNETDEDEPDDPKYLEMEEEVMDDE